MNLFTLAAMQLRLISVRQGIDDPQGKDSTPIIAVIDGNSIELNKNNCMINDKGMLFVNTDGTHLLAERSATNFSGPRRKSAIERAMHKVQKGC